MDKLLTYTEAANRLGITRRTIYRMIDSGAIEPVPATLPTGRTAPRIPTSQIDALLGATK